MSTLEKRLIVLEESAKLLAAQPKPHTSSLSIDELEKRFNEILTRKRPERTQEEVIADFKAYALQRRADWELRHGQS
jgi:hypothetical protein